MKKFPKNQNKKRKKVIIGAGVTIAVVGLGSWYGWSAWQAHHSSPFTQAAAPAVAHPEQVDMAALQKSKMATSELARKHLQSQDWAAVTADLDDAKTLSMVLNEIQHTARESKFSAADTKTVLGLLEKNMQTKHHDPRDWNLLTRCLSAFNLTNSQVKSFRNIIETKSESRLKKNYLLHSFLGTMPYPTDLKNKLIQDLSGKDVSQASESLYFVASMADRQSSHTIYESLLKKYATLNPVLKPLVIKSMFYSGDQVLLKSPAFLKIKAQAKNQKGEAWKELQVAFAEAN